MNTRPVALRDFRNDVYASFTHRRDARVELVDALPTADTVPSPVHLGLAPSHRRGWESLYAALAHGRLDVAARRAPRARHPPADGQRISAVECSVWVREDAAPSPARGFSYQPSRHSAGQPIVAGWSYQWLAQRSFGWDRWTAPLDAQRVPPADDANETAIQQIQRLCRHLPVDGPPPLCVFDAGSDPVPLLLGLAETRAALLVRLRRDRCCSADPTSQPRTGRPRRHGATSVCADPATWPAPSDEIRAEDRWYGSVRVRAWAGLHPQPQLHPTRDTRKTHPVVRGTLVLVEVGRRPRPTRLPKRLWLWWAGPGTPGLEVLWRAYVHRFAVGHTPRGARRG